MKKHQFLTLTLSATILMTACRKNDIQHANTGSDASQSIAWRAINNWSQQKDGNSVSYRSQQQAPAISSGIASDGLVLVYQKSGNTISSLPYEITTGAGTSSWYYQVSEGELTLINEISGMADFDASAASFSTLLFTAEKIKQLEAKGIEKADMMKLSYENAISLLK